MKKLYVGNFPYETTEQDLTELFSQHGAVTSVNIIRDKYTDRSKGFGFVEMENDDEAEIAIEALEGNDYSGRSLRVNEAREKTEGGGGGNRGGGYGGNRGGGGGYGGGGNGGGGRGRGGNGGGGRGGDRDNRGNGGGNNRDRDNKNRW